MAPLHYRLLLLSTPVGALGSGLGGGVELFIKNATQGLRQRGHSVTVVAPEHSVLDTCDRLIEISGTFQPTAHTSDRTAPVVMPEPSVLSAMWDYARQVQSEYDLILHYAYDWLPFYLTPFLQIPVAHYISMSSLSDVLDQTMGYVAEHFPGTVGVCTQVQAETFPFAQHCRLIGSSVDLNLYDYCDTPGEAVAWLGRISPEKGLEDAIAAVQATQTPLKILGKLENLDYWHQLQVTFPDAPIEYLGFLPTREMQAAIRTCCALLMTPKWIEAFGNVAIEALACGVPVISYRRGGPTEIVHHGKTGWLVEPDNVAELATAIQQISQLDRQACRQQAETEFSLEAMASRYEKWFGDILATFKQPPV